MKKRFFCVLSAMLLLFSCVQPAYADRIPSRDDLYVAFTAQETMESNFLNEGETFSESASNLQPGDSILYSIEIRNDHTGLTDWYMKNEVIHSLERASNTARGGAYTYILRYVNPEGESEDLYNSSTVGGTASDKGALEGLIEATGGLKDYFFVDCLSSGERAKVTLLVELDGETQGNDYQDTLADLNMQFAVELLRNQPTTPDDPRDEYESPNPESTNPPRPTGAPPTGSPPGGGDGKIVKTGDELELNRHMLIFSISGAVTGLLALSLALDGLRRKRRAEK